MRDLKNYDGLIPADVRFLRTIEEYAWHVVSVAPRVDSDDKEEWLAYSTEWFFRFRQPEIMRCGLLSKKATAIINEIGNGVPSGRKFRLDEDYTDITADDLKCRLRPVDVGRYSDYVCMSSWFYQSDDVPVWQCFWAGKWGRYSWDPERDRKVAELRAKLYEPGLPIQ